MILNHLSQRKLISLLFYSYLLAPCYAFATTSISTCTDLQNMRLNLNSQYILSNDIDCSGFPFIPVGTSESPFTGVLDGSGHKIKELNINRKNDEYVGLFGVTKGATISRLTLENVQILGKSYAGSLIGQGYNTNISDISSSGKVSVLQIKNQAHNVYMGSIAGYLLDHSSLVRISSSANVSLQEPVWYSDKAGGLIGQLNDSSITQSHTSGNVRGNYAGGLVAYMLNGSVTYSYATGEVDASALKSGGEAGSIGGLIGAIAQFDLSNPFLISHCYATGNVGIKYPSPFVGHMGGLIGRTYSSSSNCPTASPNCRPRIENNYATGDVHASLADVAGLIGLVNPGYLYIVNNYSSGKVTWNPPSGYTGYFIGGLVGRVKAPYSTKYFTNNYWDIETSGQTAAAGSNVGYGRKTFQMYQQSNYVNWNFDTIWRIHEGQGYPFLIEIGG